jgi:hypothetical protein
MVFSRQPLVADLIFLADNRIIGCPAQERGLLTAAFGFLAPDYELPLSNY